MLHVICIKKRKTRSFYYLQIPLPLIHNFIKFTKGMQINFSNFCIIWFYFYFLKRFYLFNFRERGKEKERENIHQLPSCTNWAGNLACNPGLCPDLELNRQLFGFQSGLKVPVSINDVSFFNPGYFKALASVTNNHSWSYHF